MKRLVITWILAVALFGLAGTAEAVIPVVKTKPFIFVSTTPDVLDFGTSSLFGSRDLPAALTVDVESNCLHGPPERILVKAPVTGQFVTMEKPVFISEPTEGPHKIPLDFKVQTEIVDPAGKYKGTLTFTIMPPS